MPVATIPAIPPRPSRGSDKDSSNGSMPAIPPRPLQKKRPDRSISPGPDRFAPSPLNEGFPAKNRSGGLLSPGFGSPGLHGDFNDSSSSLPMPSVGEEGAEYRAVTEGLEEPAAKPTSPEQTSTVAADLQLHAPKPSLPASSAKQRVAAVTRTDSDRAASFGIGRAHGGEERGVSRERIKKKPSTSFSTTSDQGQQTDDEHGIPEIGQRVPMNPNLGDVQAPSPAPSENNRHHSRKHSARGLPPGSYGLHGHGVVSSDKFEKAYYQKHPEALKREEHTPIHDRQNDYAMSSVELNRLVRDTASRGTGLGGPEANGTPTDEVAFQASEEYATRMASPRPASRARKSGEHRRSSSLAKVTSNTLSVDFIEPTEEDKHEYDDEAIHVDDAKHPQYRSYGDEEPGADGEDHEYHAPILASDEVSKDPSGYYQQPAVHPRPGSTDIDEGPSRPVSRPTSIHQSNSQAEVYQTPLEDVEEYEPLFQDEAKQTKPKVELADENKNHYHFPSKDIWEDAPSSVHYTATVSTPDLLDTEHHKRSSSHHDERALTPAQLFAKHQEELAEKEASRRAPKFMPLTAEDRPTWAAHQAHLKVTRPSSGPRFPSRDVWEDVPESQLQEATLSSSSPVDNTPEVPSRPAKKASPDAVDRPIIPDRPKPRQLSGDDKPKPAVTEKLKPQVPSRPSKAGTGDSKDEAASKSKPPVPKRPMGGKIAALQAGFMNDLNQRLQLGPQGPKKEESQEEETVVEEKEKAPLTDARKSRARGPQRRAPAKSSAPSVEPSSSTAPVLSFSVAQSSWSIDPEVGHLVAGEEDVTNEPDNVEPVEPQKVDEPELEPVSVPESHEPVEDDTVDTKTYSQEQDTIPQKTEEPALEEKTLVANTAGESVLETTVEKKDGDIVEPVSVADSVKA